MENSNVVELFFNRPLPIEIFNALNRYSEDKGIRFEMQILNL
jgi:hypothetical protein